MVRECLKMENLLIPLEYRQDETRESPGTLAGVLMTYGTKAKDRARDCLK